MPLVVDLARPAVRPTQAQYVDILQSQAEPHLPSKKNYDDAAFIAALAAQNFDGLTDDRAHNTGSEAISLGASLIGAAFINWTEVGDVVSGGGDAIVFQGTTGTINSPSEASITQGLSDQPTVGQEIRISCVMDHILGNAVDVSIVDDNGEYKLEGVFAGRTDSGAAVFQWAFVAPRTLVNSKVVFRDDVGSCQMNLASIAVYRRDQSL